MLGQGKTYSVLGKVKSHSVLGQGKTYSVLGKGKAHSVPGQGKSTELKNFFSTESVFKLWLCFDPIFVWYSPK